MSGRQLDTHVSVKADLSLSQPSPGAMGGFSMTRVTSSKTSREDELVAGHPGVEEDHEADEPQAHGDDRWLLRRRSARARRPRRPSVRRASVRLHAGHSLALEGES